MECLYCDCLERNWNNAWSEGGVDQSGEEWQDVLRDVLEKGEGIGCREQAQLDITSVRTSSEERGLKQIRSLEVRGGLGGRPCHQRSYERTGRVRDHHNVELRPVPPSHAINKMHLYSLSITYSCPYHNPTATMSHSIHNVDISKSLIHMMAHAVCHLPSLGCFGYDTYMIRIRQCVPPHPPIKQNCTFQIVAIVIVRCEIISAKEKCSLTQI